jgi:hypothetical protein
MDDILGSDIVYNWVVGDGMWGETVRHAFVSLHLQNLVDYFERRVRYAALYAPLSVMLSLAFATVAHRSHRLSAWGTTLVLAVAASMLFLSRLVVITWAGTDNLTELIAVQGPFSMPGWIYLDGLAALIAVNAAAIVRASDSSRWAVPAAILSVVGVPLGWMLLQSGLDPQVHKYGLTFPAVQFLLGPDRATTLTSGALFLRYALLHVSSVLVLAVGGWLGKPFSAGDLQLRSAGRGRPADAQVSGFAQKAW